MRNVQTITVSEAHALLQDLVTWEALELSYEDKPHTDVYIPYLMNDAVEYYLCFHDCIVNGFWNPTVSGQCELSFTDEAGRTACFLKQPSGNVLSIWYKEIQKSITSYQYHLIGHNWRRTSGEEHLRRLVNLLCVIHDKYTYLGASFCNKLEILLHALAEFGPLRYFSPINESILDWYPETISGCHAMKAIAEMADDQAFITLIEKYEASIQTGRLSEKKIKKLAEKLLEPSHASLYDMLLSQITAASSEWPAREYPMSALHCYSQTIPQMRHTVEQRYKAMGYHGSYPILRKGSSEQSYDEIQFVEEHPFTILESDDYTFKIYSLHFSDHKFIKMNHQGQTW